MTTPNETSETSTTTTEEVKPPEGETTTEETSTEETLTDEQKEASKLEELPEWARKEITTTRAEAANYRTRLRDAEAKLTEAKTPEEFEAAVAEVKATNETLERSVQVERAARKHGLPDELAEELQFLPLDKIEARAKVLAKYVGTAAPTSLSGGLDPTNDDDGEMDPRKLALQSRRR